MFSWAASEAAEHRVEKLNEPAPADAVSKEIAKLLQPTGAQIIRGSTRKICDIWLCKQWQLKSFDKPADVNYPFQPGQLIGVVRYHRKGADFRDQDIEDGVYTLRYAQQPIDGAHVGTSPTRDFLLLLSAAKDRSPAVIEYKPLTEQSAQAVGTTHPGLLSLQRVEGKSESLPSIRENPQHDWWIVRMESEARAGDQAKKLPIDLVVVGQAAE